MKCLWLVLIALVVEIYCAPCLNNAPNIVLNDCPISEVVWDGTSSTGNPLPDGTYRVTVGSVDLNGVPMLSQTFVTGRVTGVEFDESGTMLALGALKVPLDKVIAIHAATNNDQA